VMGIDRKQKGKIGRDGRRKGVMGDENEWWETKSNDGKRTDGTKIFF
jgi:hypothetical protein